MIEYKRKDAIRIVKFVQGENAQEYRICLVEHLNDLPVLIISYDLPQVWKFIADIHMLLTEFQAAVKRPTLVFDSLIDRFIGEEE